MKIMFVPVDIDLQLDKAEILDHLNPTGHFYVWDMEKLTDVRDGKYGKNEFTEEAKLKYPKLINSLGLLPFTHISNVKINCQTDRPALHIDFKSPAEGQELAENVKGNEPSGYRILIKGGRDSLIVHDGVEECETFIPEDTDCYLLDQSTALHAVKDDPGRVIVYVTGFIDREKHQELLERSIKKYEKFAIRYRSH